MVRRTRKQRGGFLGNVLARAKQMAAQTPLGQAALQARQDYRSLVNSPAASLARQSYGIPPPTTGYANPYGRSAGPVGAPVPMAQPVPVATPVPVARAVAALPSGMNQGFVDTVVNGLLWNEADAAYRTRVATLAADVAKDTKKSTAWNQSLSTNLRDLATEVTRLIKEEGVQPGPTSFRNIASPADARALIEHIAGQLADPAFRSAVAQRLVTSKRDPADQRFLPGTINQLAAAIYGAVQKVAFGGRKTRRGRKVRRTTRRR